MDFIRKSGLSYYKRDRLIEHFVSGSTSLTAARLCGEIKVGGSYFGGRRMADVVAGLVGLAGKYRYSAY